MNRTKINPKDAEDGWPETFQQIKVEVRPDCRYNQAMHPDLVRCKQELQMLSSYRILGLGDSLTYGWEVGRGFFDRFVDTLADRHSGVSIQRQNAGVPGDTAAGGLERVRLLSRQSYHLAVVQFGLNDCFSGVPVHDFVQALSGIASELKARNTIVVLTTSCLLENPRDMAMARTYYQAMVKLGIEQSLPVAELDRYWETRARVLGPAERWNTDGVHPNDVGHTLMAEGLMAMLD